MGLEAFGNLLKTASEAADATSAAQESGPQFFSLVNIDPSTIVLTLINTLIITLLYFFFLHKPVLGMLDKRANMVNKEIDEAEKAKADAAEIKTQYEEKLAESKEEAATILASATKKAQLKEDEIIAKANKEAGAIKVKAEESIEREKKRAVNEIKDQISDIVILAASKVAEKEISEKDNEEIINNVLLSVGEE